MSAGGRLGEQFQLLLGFLTQEVQLKCDDLQRGVHLVDKAQAAAAHAGVAIVTHQLLEAPLQDFVFRRVIRG